MVQFVYLSAPYTSSEAGVRDLRARACAQAMADLIVAGQCVICPVVMNHEALRILDDRRSGPNSVYWSCLETRLAETCDELVVLQLPGWEDSRGVAREVELFRMRGKPIRFLFPLGPGGGDDSSRPSNLGSGERSEYGR